MFCDSNVEYAYDLGVNATETEVRRRRGVTSVEPCGPECFRHLTKEMVWLYLLGTRKH